MPLLCRSHEPVERRGLIARNPRPVEEDLAVKGLRLRDAIICGVADQRRPAGARQPFREFVAVEGGNAAQNLTASVAKAERPGAIVA